jgi:hypothetical protein
VLKIEASELFEELVNELEKIKNGKHAEVQRFYNKAQHLLGGSTTFPVLMFRAFTETSGESQFSTWRDITRRELGLKPDAP